MLEALHDAKSEQIMAVFCAASWFPQNKKFFLDKAMDSIVIFGLIASGFIIGAILTLLDRETPQNYDIGKNFSYVAKVDTRKR